jgi:hypothetical protein
MSEVTLIIIAGGRLRAVTAHWRAVRELLDGGIQGVRGRLSHRAPLDAGYILADLDAHRVITAQRAFDVRRTAIGKSCEVTEL